MNNFKIILLSAPSANHIPQEGWPTKSITNHADEALSDLQGSKIAAQQWTASYGRGGQFKQKSSRYLKLSLAENHKSLARKSKGRNVLRFANGQGVD